MDRNKALERVAKLCQVTVERSATEQEEAAAATRVDALVARHGLTPAQWPPPPYVAYVNGVPIQPPQFFMWQPVTFTVRFK